MLKNNIVIHRTNQDVVRNVPVKRLLPSWVNVKAEQTKFGTFILKSSWVVSKFQIRTSSLLEVAKTSEKSL